jgi:hypothetical protein
MISQYKLHKLHKLQPRLVGRRMQLMRQQWQMCACSEGHRCKPSECCARGSNRCCSFKQSSLRCKSCMTDDILTIDRHCASRGVPLANQLTIIGFSAWELFMSWPRNSATPTWATMCLFAALGWCSRPLLGSTNLKRCGMCFWLFRHRHCACMANPLAMALYCIRLCGT